MMRRTWSELAFFGRHALVSYRALFGWITPRDYLLLKVLEPAFQLMFFCMMAVFAGLDASYLALGNAVRLAAISGIYSCAPVIRSERGAGTLQVLIAAPTPTWQTFLARAVMPVFDGLLTVVVGLIIGGTLFDLSFAQVNWVWLALGIVITSYAMTGLGMLVGASGLVGTDVFFLMNLVFAVLIVLCGVNFPISLLPEPVQVVSQLLPLTHGLRAVRLVFDGELARVPGLLLIEFALGCVYVAGGYVVFRWAEYRARVLGTLDLT